LVAQGKAPCFRVLKFASEAEGKRSRWTTVHRPLADCGPLGAWEEEAAKMAWFERDGVRLYYEVRGQGLPLVLTHGASWDHGQWAPKVAALVPEYQVIVWDVRGHGQSDLPPGPVDHDDFHRDVVALLNHLALPRVALGGLSTGGHISLRTAARHPERAAALILIGTPFTNSDNWYEQLAMPINRFSQRLMPISLIARSQA
jgi:pimeloyl-ACP methyl ester carboxylesterase